MNQSTVLAMPSSSETSELGSMPTDRRVPVSAVTAVSGVSPGRIGRSAMGTRG
jgi:hypothetical protein